jgi:hypothetical protein
MNYTKEYIKMKHWLNNIGFKINVFFDRLFKKNNSNRLLGNISGSTFVEIKEQLSGMKVAVFNITAEGFSARFSDKYTEYVLSFSSIGIVIGLVTEYWKDTDVFIDYRI